MIDLTRAEAAAVAQMIEFNIFDSIRNDPGIDNLQWLVAVVHAWEKLDAASREPEEPKEDGNQRRRNSHRSRSCAWYLQSARGKPWRKSLRT